MKKAKYTEKQFIEYLDKLLAGEEISLGDDVSDDLRSALELARKMLAYRDEPSADFRADLRDRLLHKIAEAEAAATPAKRQGFREWTANLFPQRPALIAVTSTVLVVLLIFVGTVWYTGRYGQAPVSAPTPSLTERDYSVNLPSNVTPEYMAFIAKTSLSTKPGQVPVYKVQSTDVTTESVTELGRRLGFSGEARFIDGGDKIAMFDGEGDEMRKFIVWTASGAIEYGYVEPDKLYPSHAVELPSQPEAEQIAYDFLEQADLLPSGYQSLAKIKDETTVIAGGYSVSREYAAEAPPAAAPSAPSWPWKSPAPSAPTAPLAPAYWLISFPYQIDHTWTTGPGSKIEVSVGDNGEVVGLIWSWRQMTPRTTENIISEKQAYQELIQGKGSLDIPLDCQQVVVEDVQLKYWLDPPSEKQAYAVPVYEFTGQCLDKSGRHLEDFTAWTPALSSTY
ncbi:MAG: hypothetical protein FJ023_02955 [Chloroflexi bacterium]|nr:hypothetical protein [Chloroflexota bacterium]